MTTMQYVTVSYLPSRFFVGIDDVTTTQPPPSTQYLLAR